MPKHSSTLPADGTPAPAGASGTRRAGSHSVRTWLARTRLAGTQLAGTRLVRGRLSRVALVAGLVVAPLAISVPAQSATDSATVAGWAQMYFPAPGNDVEITVDAHATFGPGEFPTKSWGTFRIYHRIDSGGQVYVNWGDFVVDCVTVGGPTSTVTGTLVRAAPNTPWQLGARTGLSFYVADKASRIGITGMPTPPLSQCMAPAASAPLVRGGYTIGS